MAESKTLSHGEVDIEQKTVEISVLENKRGRVIRLVEVTKLRRNTIMFPLPGGANFTRKLIELIKEAEQIPQES